MRLGKSVPKRLRGNFPLVSLRERERLCVHVCVREIWRESVRKGGREVYQKKVLEQTVGR